MTVKENTSGRSLTNLKSAKTASQKPNGSKIKKVHKLCTNFKLLSLSTMMFRFSVLFLSFAAVHVNGQTDITQPDPNSPCTVCFNGDAPVTEGGRSWFSGPTEMTCAGIIADVFAADTTQGTQTCKDAQLAAFQLGCCSGPPYEYCEVCPDGSPFTRSNEVPIGSATGTPPTCAENLYTPASYRPFFTPGTCADTAIQRGAHYCGCPNVQQQCYLCPDSQKPTNPERGDAWVTGTNCEGIEFLFSLFDANECDGYRNDYGIDFAHFCKCPDHVKATEDKCVLCGTGMANPGFVYTTDADPYTRTCSQAATFAESITRENSCMREMGEVIAAGCKCNDNGGPKFTVQSNNGDSGAVGVTASLSMFVAALLALNSVIA
jgi:hypothetical protein